MIRSIVLATYYALSILVVGSVGIPYSIVVGDVSWLYRTAMRIAHFGLRLVGVRLNVIGLDRFDHNRTYVYMFNHVSNLDPPVVIPLVPRRTSVLLKKELMRIPILSRAMRMADFVPVDRRNRDAAINSIGKAVEVLRHGVNISIFPEGTRSRDGKMLPFKKGPFHLAVESGTDIMPVTIYGTEKMLPKGRFAIRPGVATVIFHRPMSPKSFTSREELMEAVRREIESALPPEMRSS